MRLLSVVLLLLNVATFPLLIMLSRTAVLSVSPVRTILSLLVLLLPLIVFLSRCGC